MRLRRSMMAVSPRRYLTKRLTISLILQSRDVLKESYLCCIFMYLNLDDRVQSNLAIVKCINPTDPFTIAIISL